MIDYGLLVSIIIGFGLPSVLIWWWPVGAATATGADGGAAPPPAPTFVDVALGPALAALVVGRLTTLAVDDPDSIGSISDMLIIRSGVEFWPGVVAGAVVAWWAGRGAAPSPLGRLVEVAPLAMVGYAGFEAACLFRDGCFGPESTIGLRPPGLSTTMVPVGLVMAAAVAAAALVVHRLAMRRVADLTVLLVALVAVAATRSVGSIWLPHVGDGLTRQHLASIVVAVVAGVVLMAVGIGRSVAVRSADAPA